MDKKRAPNFSITEKTLLLNLISDFKHIVENKQTNSQTWRDKNEAWIQITDAFNSRTPEEYPRTKDALKKYYDNIKKSVRKEVAEDKKELTKTGGGRPEIKTNPIKELALGLMNEKTVYGLKNNYDNDRQLQISNSQSSSLETENISGSIGDITDNFNTEPTKALEDHNYLQDENIHDTPSTSQDEAKVFIPNSKKRPSVCLKDTWTKRRRPAIQQLSSSKLSEEYLALATVKRECFLLEKENMQSKRQRDDEIFELEKQKLLLDIKIKEHELHKYESNI